MNKNVEVRVAFKLARTIISDLGRLEEALVLFIGVKTKIASESVKMKQKRFFEVNYTSAFSLVLRRLYP
ncbi:MAG: hypothetical protein JWO06_4112 [Bacteroidota bacterium]|nr:hypothetical protein [Bacteroidota bacterium]